MPAAQWSSPGDEPVLAHNGGVNPSVETIRN
jgi:hypothetical protein